MTRELKYLDKTVMEPRGYYLVVLMKQKTSHLKLHTHFCNFFSTGILVIKNQGCFWIDWQGNNSALLSCCWSGNIQNPSVTETLNTALMRLTYLGIRRSAVTSGLLKKKKQQYWEFMTYIQTVFLILMCGNVHILTLVGTLFLTLPCDEELPFESLWFGKCSFLSLFLYLVSLQTSPSIHLPTAFICWPLAASCSSRLTKCVRM